MPASSTRTPWSAAATRPLHDEMATIDDAADADALAAVIGALQRTGAGGGVGVYVDTDSKDSTRYLVHFTQSGLGLPDESYYRDERHAEVLAAYPGHIARMFGLVYRRATRPTTSRPRPASSRWRPNLPRRTGTWSSAATLTSATTCARSPTCRPKWVGFDWAGWATALGAGPEVALRN